MVSFLLDQGALVNKANDDGSTALIWAAHAGKLECVRLLLMQDADISTSGTGGFSGTALEVSRLRRHAAIGRLLETAARDGGPAAVLAERRRRALTERASQARVAVRDAEVAAEPQLRSVSNWREVVGDELRAPTAVRIGGSGREEVTLSQIEMDDQMVARFFLADVAFL